MNLEATINEAWEKLPIAKLFFNDVIGPPAILTLRRLFGDTFKQHGKPVRVFDPRRVFMLPDHSIPANSVEVAEGVDLMESFGRECGFTVNREGDGIEHVVLIEDGHIVPWDIVLGTDSHTCTNGAMGALALFALAFIECECSGFGVKPGSEDLLLRPADEGAALCEGCGLSQALPGAPAAQGLQKRGGAYFQWTPNASAGRPAGTEVLQGTRERSNAGTTVVKGFARIPTGVIGDCMGRCNSMFADMKPAWPGAKIVGAALTVRTFPADNLMIHKAVTLAKPGDVLVVNAGGYKDYAIFGDLLGLSCKVHEIAGLIIDGATRDAEGMQAIGFPVFARAILPAGPFKDPPGAINVPVSSAGVPVRPGDIIVGDADGVVVVPQEHAADILAKAQTKVNKDKG